MEEFLRRGDFVVVQNLAFEEIGGGYISLAGTITCVNGIYIDVRKNLRVWGGEGANALVQTESYSYSGVIAGLGNLVRYDSPHPTHNQEHHVHRFDPLGGDTEGTVTFLHSEDERPTLGEVITEVSDWYYDNVEEVIRRTVGGR